MSTTDTDRLKLRCELQREQLFCAFDMIRVLSPGLVDEDTGANMLVDALLHIETGAMQAKEFESWHASAGRDMRFASMLVDALRDDSISDKKLFISGAFTGRFMT